MAGPIHITMIRDFSCFQEELEGNKCKIRKGMAIF